MRKLTSVNIKMCLSATSALVFLLLSVLITLYTYQTQFDSLVRSNQAFLQHDLAEIALQADRSLALGAMPEIKRLLSNKMLHNNYQNIVLLDHTKHVISSAQSKYANQPLSKTSLPVDLALFEQLQSKAKPIIEFQLSNYTFYGYFPVTTIKRDHEIRPMHRGLLFASYSLRQEMDELLSRTLIKSLISASFLFVLLCFIFTFAYLYIHRPIAHICRVGELISKENLDYRAQITGSGEFANLANSFNHMADSLQEKLYAQQQAELQALQKHHLLQSIFNALPDLFFIVDVEGVVREFHSGNHDNLYLDIDKILHRKISDVVPTKIANKFYRAINTVHTQHSLELIEYNLAIKGQPKSFEARLSNLPNSDQVVVVIRDITQRKQQEEIILHHAFYDSLTDLPNRFLVIERLNQQIKAAKRERCIVAVLFIDLDDFKKVNDTLGHEVGDQLLIESAHRLQAPLREHDTVARLGGDEFIILLPSIKHSNDIHPITAELVNSFRKPFILNGRTLTLSISVGVAIYPQDGKTPDELLRKADSAMYNSKHNGRDTFSFFTEQMGHALSRQLLIEEHLHHALMRNEIEVYYQPQVNLNNRETIGAEALLRWFSPTLGNVPPDEFIPIAERNGEIINLGKFVLKAAIEQANIWQAQLNKTFRIAINFSPRQLNDPSLINDISQLIKNNHSAPHQVELEITEGVLLSGDAKVKDTLFDLHQIGLLISMDDFGTGYSSLSYLRHYPFDVLKIDRSFIQDLPYSKPALKLVKSIIAMAHSLNLTVIAEGVESEIQLQLITDLKCDIAQGYLFGKPMSVEEFDRWLDNHSVLPHNSSS